MAKSKISADSYVGCTESSYAHRGRWRVRRREHGGVHAVPLPVKFDSVRAGLEQISVLGVDREVMEEQRGGFFVPWADRSEWTDVRKRIISEDVGDLMRAHEIMSVWKQRSDSLPAYVDCTAGILQVMVCDQLTKFTDGRDLHLSLTYSTALIRFVNHVHDVSDHRRNTLYNAARIQNIPDWIVTLRHDAAHGRELPSLQTFRMAARVALQWLMDIYWYHGEMFVTDEANVPDCPPVNSEDEVLQENLNLSLLPIYKSAVHILEICFDALAISLTHDSSLSQDQLHSIRDLVNLCTADRKVAQKASEWTRKISRLVSGRECDGNSKLNGFGLEYLKKTVFALIKSITIERDEQYTFVESVLQSDFMLDINRKGWSEMLRFMQKLKCFNMLMKSLFGMAAENHSVALEMLNALLLSLKALQKTWSWRMKVTRAHSGVEKEKLFKIRMQRKHMRHCKKLQFVLRIQKPPRLKLDTMMELIANPAPHSWDLIRQYLALVEPQMGELAFRDLNTLVDAYSGDQTAEDSQTPLDENGRIYTLEDITEKESSLPLLASEQASVASVSDGATAWFRSALGAEAWNYCPLGLLPHQQQVGVDLPPELCWASAVPSRIRPLLSHRREDLQS